MNNLDNKLMYAAAACGVSTLILGIILLVIFPSSAELREGFKTPIIAFEFAKTDSDLRFLSGASEQSIENRERMDLGHLWDMVFPFAYGGFIALLLVQIARTNKRFAWTGVVVALMIIPFDINENRVMLDITSALEAGLPVEALLIELNIATWLKWGAIGISVAILSVGLFTQQRYFLALVGGLTSTGIAVCFITDALPIIAEIMSMITFLLFIVLTINTLSIARRLKMKEGTE